MGATSSRPSDAELSWETELYRYDVRSIPGKIEYINHAPGSIRRDTYVISVNKRNSAGRPKARDRSYEEPDYNTWVGVDLLNMDNDSGDIDDIQLLVKPSSTTWEALCSNFERTILSWQRSESAQHEDVEIVTPVECECVANCRSSYVPPWWSLKLADWHKPVSEITEGCELDLGYQSIFCKICKVDPEQRVINYKTWADTWADTWTKTWANIWTDGEGPPSATTSHPSDADWSWETDEHRFDVTSASTKTDDTRHECYLISVSKPDSVEPSAHEPSPALNARERTTNVAEQDQIGLRITYPGEYPNRKEHWFVRVGRTSTVWEAFHQHFGFCLSQSVLSSLRDGDPYLELTSEEVDEAKRGTWECAALNVPSTVRQYYVKRDDWHKPIGEIVKLKDEHRKSDTYVVCLISKAKPEGLYSDIETESSSTVSETDSETFSVSEMFETISLSTLLCGIVIGMTLAKFHAEKAH